MAHQLEELEQAHTLTDSPAHIECFSPDSASGVAYRSHRIAQIIDEENIPHLSSIAVDRDAWATQRAENEVRNPPLVLVAELAWPVYTAHAKNDCAKPKAPSVVMDILISRPLRAS